LPGTSLELGPDHLVAVTNRRRSRVRCFSVEFNAYQNLGNLLKIIAGSGTYFAKENFMEGWTYIIGTGLREFVEKANS